MQIQKIIILGLLEKSPCHGYEIKKIAKEKLGIFSSLKNKSFYYPLKIMEEKGYITKKGDQGQEGPARYIYSITQKGKKEFSRLALETLTSQKRPFIDIDIPLYFLPLLEKKEVIARLRLRKRFLKKVKGWFADKLGLSKNFSPYQKMLLKHHLNLLNAEEDFADNIIKIVKNY
ncbi:MAG: PadR family transcriptional regulator [Candidatus Omnitrophica bacterium]|nr:PadR family transcriptional regulator [Candidatus Omnitrophota bacterium]